MTKKEQNARRVRKLWDGGEKFNAITLADELKVSEDDRPKGMKAHIAGLRRELR